MGAAVGKVSAATYHQKRMFSAKKKAAKIIAERRYRAKEEEEMIPTVDSSYVSTDSGSILGALAITVIEGRALPFKGVYSASPFVVVTYGQHSFETQVISNDHPVWEQKHHILIRATENNLPIRIEIFNISSVLRYYLMGFAELQSNEFFDGKVHDIWVEMGGNKKKHSKKKKKDTFCVGGGELRLKIQLIPMQELEKVFWTNFADVYDWDSNGVISQMELRLMLEGLGSTITDEKASTIIQSWTKAHPNKGNEVPIEDIAEIMRGFSEQHLVNMKRCPICSQPITKKSRPQRLINGENGKHLATTGKFEGRREREGMHWGKTQWDERDRSDSKYEYASSHANQSFTTSKGHVTTDQAGEITDDVDIIVHVSNCIQEHPNVAFEVSGGFLWDVVEYKGWLQKMVLWSKHQHPIKSDTGNMVVKDRESNEFVEERIPPFDKIALRALYTSNAESREQEALEILKRITTKVGSRFGETSSRKHIHPFISFYNIDTSEFLVTPETYVTFNDFFHRKLRPHSRPIAVPYNTRVAVVPADSRALVFESIDRATKLWIKGYECTLEGLLQSVELAKEYEGGSFALFRLGPQDAHRFFVPISCTIGQTREIDGEYCTINPIAIREGIPIPVLNKRTITVLETNDFGDVLYIVVGSTMVGSITLTSKMGEKMNKGDEMGYFSFGGSLLILLFRKNSVVFADDLLANSSRPIETYSKMGTPLAVAKQE